MTEIVKRNLSITKSQWRSLQSIARRLGFMFSGKPAVNRLILYWLEMEMNGMSEAQTALAQAVLAQGHAEPILPDEDGNIEKFADVLPQEWIALHRRLRQNPNLLNLKEDLAIIELLQREIIDGISAGECKEIWLQLKELANDAISAHRDGDHKKYSEAINSILRSIGNGLNASLKREEILKTIELKAKTIKVQSEIDVRTQQLLPRETYEILINKWKEAVAAEVGSEALERISQRYAQVILENSWGQ